MTPSRDQRSDMVEVTRQDLKTMQRLLVSHVKSICCLQSVSLLLRTASYSFGRWRSKAYVHVAHVSVIHAAVVHTAVTHVSVVHVGVIHDVLIL